MELKHTVTEHGHTCHCGKKYDRVKVRTIKDADTPKQTIVWDLGQEECNECLAAKSASGENTE